MLHKIIGSIILTSYLHAAPAADFHIEAGNASHTLNEFSRQTGIQILFDFSVVDQMLTGPLNGEMGVDEALEILLRGTDLSYDYINTHTMAIMPRPRVDSDALARSLRQFESPAQSWPEGAGPHVHKLIVEIVGATKDDYIATR